MYTVPHMTHNVTKPLQKCYVCGYNREGEEGGGGERESVCILDMEVSRALAS